MDYRLEQLRFELQEDPTSRVFFKLGEHLRRIGELDEAVDVLRQGLDTHPHYVSAWVSLGRSLHDLGDTQGAWQAFSRACELDPENGVAARCAGEAAIANGEWIEAVKNLKRARGMMPQDDALDERIAFVEERLEELGMLEAPRPPAPAPEDEPADEAVFEVETAPDDGPTTEPDDVFESGALPPDPDPVLDAAPEPVPVPDEPSEEPEIEFFDEPSGVIAEAPSSEPVPVPDAEPGEPPDEPELEFIDEPSDVMVDAPSSEPVPVPDEPSGVIFDAPPSEPDPVSEAPEPFHEPAPVDVADEPPPPPPDLMYQPEPVPVPEGEPAESAPPEPELEFVDEPSGVVVEVPPSEPVPVPVSVPDAEPGEPPDEPELEFVDEPSGVVVEAPPSEPVPVPAVEPAEPAPPEPVRRTEGPLPTMTLARLAVEQGDLELARTTARGVLDRDPASHEARQMLEWLDTRSAEGDDDRTADGDGRARALRRWLDAVRLAAEKLES